MNSDCNCNKVVFRETENLFDTDGMFAQTFFNIDGTTFEATTPEELKNTGIVISGNYEIRYSNGSTINLVDPTKELLQFYLSNPNVKIYSSNGQQIVFGNDNLFHFVEIPTQTQIPTNDGNFDPLGDLSDYLQGGVDVHINQPIKETQDAIDAQIANLTAQFNLTIQQANDAAAAAVLAAQNAATDGIAAATKAATDAATAAATAAAAGIDEGTKDLQKKLLYGAVAAIGIVVLVVAVK